MGATLPKPVKSLVVKRRGGPSFRVGFAEMNGHRVSMEDAHVVWPQDDWGFFGVFDGHGGDQCSNYIGRKLEAELEKGMPRDDAQMKEIALRLDQEFLDEGLPSGSTGTFTVIETPQRTGGDWKLRVGNIGDSRVVLGGIDGQIVPGEGTDKGLTTDHKPDHPSERERIIRTGGQVVAAAGGVSRVNGDLAVSRAFGDADFKKTGGPGPEDHPVTADPEFCTLTCRPTDFVLLVCDGISEGDFKNEEAVATAAAVLNKRTPPDPADAACAVCRKALERGSKDNLSCMVVLLGGGEIPGPELTLLPGPFECPGNQNYRRAYECMAKHAGLSLAEAISRRFDLAQEELRLAQAATEDADSDEILALKKELSTYEDGPPAELAPGSIERTEWFERWLEQQVEMAENNDGTGHASRGSTPGGGFPPHLTPQSLVALLTQGRPHDVSHLQELFGNMQVSRPKKCLEVCVALDELQSAVETHPALTWNPTFAELCGQKCQLQSENQEEGLSQVLFNSSETFSNEPIWLPSSCLKEFEAKFSVHSKVHIASEEEVHKAVEEHKSIPWDPKITKMCDQEGLIEEIDTSDDSAKVRGKGLSAWLPFSVLTEITDEDVSTTASSCDDYGGT